MRSAACTAMSHVYLTPDSPTQSFDTVDIKTHLASEILEHKPTIDPRYSTLELVLQ